MIWDMLPLVSYTFAGVAALHSVSLFALRAPANDVDSISVALTGLVMDCMAIPMAYFIPKYGFHPVRLVTAQYHLYYNIADDVLTVTQFGANLYERVHSLDQLLGSSSGAQLQGHRLGREGVHCDRGEHRHRAADR